MDVSLRTTFEREAERYARSRPAPPDAVIGALLAVGHLRPGDRVLEIGCGTGQATVPLAERGLSVHALELGPTLAALARKQLAAYPNVTVETIAFEDYLATTHFDALVSVQAFHWLEPEQGVRHAASLLRPGGTLLLVWHQDRLPDTPFYRAADTVHRRYEKELERPTPAYAPARFSSALTRSPDFGGLHTSRYAWQHSYTKTAYLDLLLTFSNIQALTQGARDDLLGEIAALLDAHGGSAVRHYESVLLGASRRP